MNKGNVLRGGKRGKNSPINLPLLDESFIKFVSSKNFIIFVRFYLGDEDKASPLQGLGEETL